MSPPASCCKVTGGCCWVNVSSASRMRAATAKTQSLRVYMRQREWNEAVQGKMAVRGYRRGNARLLRRQRQQHT
jgi:hypothetical protein